MFAWGLCCETAREAFLLHSVNKTAMVWTSDRPILNGTLLYNKECYRGSGVFFL